MSAKVPVPIRAATTAEPGTAACPEERPTGRSTAREKWTMCLGTSRPTCTSTTWSTPRIFADFDAFCKRQDTFKIVPPKQLGEGFPPNKWAIGGNPPPRVEAERYTFRGRQGTREFVFRERLSNYRPGRTWASPLTPWLFHFLLLSL